MRFKSQLFALVLSVLIPAFIAAMLAVWYVYRDEQMAQEARFLATTRAFSHLVDNELKSRQRILQTIANSPALADGNLEAFYAFAKNNAPTEDTTIILFDRTGRQLINTRAPLGAPLPAQRASTMEALMQRHGVLSPLVSDVFFAPLGKRYDFSIQVPYMERGEVRYFVAMGLNAAALQQLMAQQNLPQDWLSVIVDRKGVLVARSRDPEKFVGKPADESLQQKFSTQVSGTTRSVTLDGVPVKTFFYRVPSADWTVVLSIPETEVRRSAVRGAVVFASTSLLILGLALVVARRIGLGVIARMRRLELAAEALGRGERVAYEPLGLVEVDEVGRRIAHASDQLGAAQRELELRVAHAVEESERAQRALLQAQKMEALGRLTGGIAHEFNNLLQTLATSLQLAKRAKDPERVQSLLETCTKALKRAKTLTGQLSSFGRTQDSRLETVYLPKQVQDFRQLVENVLPATVSLEVELAEDVWPVTIDPTQFELAFLNLVINAKDAMPSGGSIKVTVMNEPSVRPSDDLPTGDYVRVSISDSGVGMTPEVMAKALDPFFTTKEVGKGTGLGLPQAFGFARQSGGLLVLSSQVDVGTKVDIYLPKADEPPVDRPARVDETADDHQPTTATLLFVEDDPLVRESVAPALEHAGYFVVMAENAEAALACLEAGTKVDFVFSDVVMPGALNGIDLAKAVQSRFPHINVVLATGYSENRVAVAGVQVLAKPYDIADVLRTLKKSTISGG